MTPLLMYLKLKGLLPKEHGIVIITVVRDSLGHYLLEHQVDWDYIELMLDLDVDDSTTILVKFNLSNINIYM